MFKTSVNEVGTQKAVAFIISSTVVSHITCSENSQAARSENMGITLHKPEVRCAGGDADMKCSAYCWGPA